MQNKLHQSSLRESKVCKLHLSLAIQRKPPPSSPSCAIYRPNTTHLVLSLLANFSAKWLPLLLFWGEQAVLLSSTNTHSRWVTQAELKLSSNFAFFSFEEQHKFKFVKGVFQEVVIEIFATARSHFLANLNVSLQTWLITSPWEKKKNSSNDFAGSVREETLNW